MCYAVVHIFFPLWQNLCFMQNAGKVERDLTAVDVTKINYVSVTNDCELSNCDSPFGHIHAPLTPVYYF